MKTPEEMILCIKQYLLENGITESKAAQMLGVTQGAVHNRLSRIDYFGNQAAAKWSAAFGFDYRFLRTGEGSLLPEQPQQEEDGVFIPARTMKFFEDLQATCRNLSELALGRRDPDLYEIKKDRPKDSPIKKT